MYFIEIFYIISTQLLSLEKIQEAKIKNVHSCQGKVSVSWYEGNDKISKKLAIDKLIAMKTEKQANYVNFNEQKSVFCENRDQNLILKYLCTRYVLIDKFTYENSEMFLLEKIRSFNSLNLEVPDKNS